MKHFLTLLLALSALTSCTKDPIHSSASTLDPGICRTSYGLFVPCEELTYWESQEGTVKGHDLLAPPAGYCSQSCRLKNGVGMGCECIECDFDANCSSAISCRTGGSGC